MKDLREEFEWCGFRWETCMESERPIHPDAPWMYYDKGCVNRILTTSPDEILSLNIKYKPISLLWGWKEKVEYTPTIACGLIKSIDTIPVNSSIECEVMMPEGANLWPSFWLTACDNWPPEIDIFEGYTDKNGSYFDKLGLHWEFPFLYRDVRMESNVHYTDDNGKHRQAMPKGDCKNMFRLPLEEYWNHFRCEWREDSIKFYINGNLHRVVKDKKILSKIKTKGMWVVFNVYPNDRFSLHENGDIEKFIKPYIIKNFKVSQL